MGFWIFMFIMTLLIPFSLLLNRYMLPKLKRINSNSGYRTSRSMKNQDTWLFAQKYCSRISLKLFFPTIILSIVIMPFLKDKSIDKIGLAGLLLIIIQMMSFLVIYFFTEKALKNTFDKDGNRY